MSTVLENQIRASAEFAASIDAQLKANQHSAELASTGEELTALAVDFFGTVKQRVERWQQLAANKQPLPAGAVTAESWIKLYRAIADLFAIVAQIIKTSEERGYHIPSRTEFKIAWRELRAIMSLEWDRVSEAAAQRDRGETHDLAEIVDELQSSPNDHRAR